MSPPAILIVDDTRVSAEAAEAMLSAEGFRTSIAYDGLSARQKSRLERPDLILLDVMMPGESGFETCARLKSDPATAHIPIIFLSSLDDVESKVTGLKIGGVDFVSKPVHAEELLARVRTHLRIRETNRLLAARQQALLDELRSAQQAILTRPEDCPGASFAVFYKPLEEAGGDFCDVVPVDAQSYGYFVADVSGHGLSAAFLTSAIKALLRQYTGPLFSVEDTMRGLDSVMRQVLGEEQYLTACYARLNRQTRRLSVVSAGHPPLVRVSQSGRVETVQMDGEPLGIFSSVVFQRKELRLALGDRFYLYSDGLIECAPNGNREEGLERLVAACLRHRAVPLEDAAQAIANDLRPEVGVPADDLLLLAVEVRA